MQHVSNHRQEPGSRSLKRKVSFASFSREDSEPSQGADPEARSEGTPSIREDDNLPHGSNADFDTHMEEDLPLQDSGADLDDPREENHFTTLRY